MKLCIILALTFMSVLGSYAVKPKGQNIFIIPKSKLNLNNLQVEHLLRHQNDYEDSKYNDDDDDEDDDDDDGEGEEFQRITGNRGSYSNLEFKPDVSSGRLFFNKLFNFGKQTQSKPNIFIIQQPSSPTTTASSSASPTSTANSNSTSTGRREIVFEEDADEDYEESIARKQQHQQPIVYKLVKGNNHQHQQGQLSIVVPSKYVRNLQNRRNTFVGQSNSGKRLRIRNNFRDFGYNKLSWKKV